MAKSSRTISIVSFGEALWDVLPKGLFLGGAPLNVAYHLSRQGVEPLLVSAVGRDFLGEEVLRRLRSWELDTKGVARIHAPTGYVVATLDRKGSAEYDIVRRVAWDRIPVPSRSAITSEPAAVVFGTLALRSSTNRRNLDVLLKRWPDAVCVADLNFRPPFDTIDAIAFALERADILKLNDSELSRLSRGALRGPKALEKAAAALSEATGITRICVTAGAQGAGLHWDGVWHWENADPVQVKDTIGAGDSFLAAFLAALFKHKQGPAEALRRAARTGEFVATQDGATPAYTLSRDGTPKVGTKKPGR